MAKVSQLLHDGYQLQVQGRLDEAAKIYRKLLRAEPSNADARILLGAALDRQRRHEEAIEQFDKAIRVRPASSEAHFNRGLALYALKRLEEAAEAYREAYRLKPDLPHAFSRFVDLRRFLCDWRDYDAVERDVLAHLRDARIVIHPGAAILFTDDPALLLAGARTAIASMNFPAPARIARDPADARSTGPIRLAYLSADFRDHAVAHIIAELIERHDRARFEVTAISVGPNDRSRFRARFEGAFDRFFDLADRSTEEIVGRIRGLGVELLVDLMGHSGGARLDVLAARAAPVQMSFIGFAGTTGAEFVDYTVVDPFVVPVDQQPCFTERLVHLPDCYQPNDTRRITAESAPTRAECGLPEDGFVFCCFNNSSKLTPRVFDVWMRLLARVPGSVLWILKDADQPAVERNLAREVAARGMNPGRVVFAPYVPLARHLARQTLADLFLDTLPWNAHGTASHALWSGLPIVTCAGRSFQSRVAGSLLRAIGLSDLVTGSLEEYEALAFALAIDRPRLAAIRQRLAHNRSTTPLFDIARYTRHIEAAYGEMVAIWRRGEAPRPFAIAPLPG